MYTQKKKPRAQGQSTPGQRRQDIKSLSEAGNHTADEFQHRTVT
jgi:hypothetical protein